MSLFENVNETNLGKTTNIAEMLKRAWVQKKQSRGKVTSEIKNKKYPVDQLLSLSVKVLIGEHVLDMCTAVCVRGRQTDYREVLIVFRFFSHLSQC